MRLVVTLLLSLALFGCNEEESTEDETTEAQALCEEWCALVDAAMCENADSECFAGCMHNAVPCLAEARAYLDCGPNIACNQDGRPTAANCQAEFMTYGECAPG